MPFKENPMSPFQSGPTLYQDTLTGGSHWSMRVRKGTLLTLTDLEGGANVGLLLYNPNDLLEKYNAPDSLKCQHTFKLTQGHCLYSDMGRVLASIVEDDCGWHDTVCGNMNKTMQAERWPPVTYQQGRNNWTQNGYDSFMVELAKYGLNRKDMAANLNLFSKVFTDVAGNLSYQPAGKAGDSVTLRFEMDTLVILHTCPHPMAAPATGFAAYPRKPVQYALAKAMPVADNDNCKNHCPENQRGFQNTLLYTFMD
jgi:urea carboxylase-associated protein 2